MKIKEQELIAEARNALKNSYSIYSNFKVGAAVQLKDGSIISGTNIENASYGLSNCAERTTLFTAYSKGYRKEDIVAFVVLSPADHLVSPCGACRQVMSELMLPNTPVYMVYGKDKIEKTTVKDLLPFSFRKEDLNV